MIFITFYCICYLAIGLLCDVICGWFDDRLGLHHDNKLSCIILWPVYFIMFSFLFIGIILDEVIKCVVKLFRRS
jgi:hypothetical protein